MNPQTLFLSRIRNYLNTQVAIRLGSFTLAVGISVALVYCFIYVFRGYAVPLSGYLIILALTLVLGVVLWLQHRINTSAAAHYADTTWELKDIFTTALHMRKKKQYGEVYDLIQSQADAQATTLKDKKLRLSFYRKTTLFTLAAFLLSFWLLSLPPSTAVQAKIAQEKMTELRTAEVQTELENYLNDLEKNLDEEEKKALKLNELKKWVKELKKTKDQRVALRQIAKLEQKISKNINKLEQRKDENTLKKVAANLMKAPMKAARKLGKDLDLKDYKKASAKLKNLKLKPQKKKPIENRKPNKLTEQQKRIAKLRALAKRMAQANKQAGKATGNNHGKGGKGKQGKLGKAGNSATNAGDMADIQDLLDELDEDLEELEQELKEMELAEGDKCENDDPTGTMKKIDGDLDKLAKRLRKMAARRKALSKLKKLRNGLAKSQSYCMGQSQMLGLGGKRAGEGTDPSKRKIKDKLKDNGQFAKLSGIKNKGPSKSSIEEAESGTGVSTKRGSIRQHSYQRMFESFVHRDDIPEDLKSGVSEYLQSIHQSQPEPTNTQP